MFRALLQCLHACGSLDSHRWCGGLHKAVCSLARAASASRAGSHRLAEGCAATIHAAGVVCQMQIGGGGRCSGGVRLLGVAPPVARVNKQNTGLSTSTLLSLMCTWWRCKMLCTNSVHPLLVTMAHAGLDDRAPPGRTRSCTRAYCCAPCDAGWIRVHASGRRRGRASNTSKTNVTNGAACACMHACMQ